MQLYEKIIDKKRSDALELFYQVVGIKNRDGMLNEPRFILKAMDFMDLGRSNKGSADGSCQYMTLLVRYLPE